MKLPSKIKIGGHEYKVLFPYKFTELTNTQGQADHLLTEIKVSEIDGGGVKLSDSKVKEVFLHEILHCVDSIYNGEKLEEETVRRLSEGLYQVLKDNNLKFGE